MKKLVAALLVMTLILGLASCGSNKAAVTTKAAETSALADGSQVPDATTAAPVKDVTLTVWASPALVSEEEMKMKQDDWYISKVAKAFEAENPGVTVEITVVSDQNAAHQTFKAAAATDSGPDIVNLWSGQSIFAMKDVILDITDMIPQADKDIISGWETVTVDFAKDGQIIGYPVSGNEVCGFIYNRTVLAEAGLDFDKNPPKTLDEFVAAMEKIKAIGKTPIAAADNGWNGAYFMSFAKLWVQANGSNRVASDSTGVTKFADDQAFLDSYSFVNELYTKGLINEDYLTIPNPDELFLNGEAGLLATGNWAIATAIDTLGEENVGFCSLPDLNENVQVKNTAIGGPGQCLVISKNCKNPEIAVKFCSFINNKENHILLLKGLSKLPIRSDVTLADVGMADKAIYKQVSDLGTNYVFWADNSMIPEVNAEMQKLGPLAITGKITPAELAAKLDAKAAEIAGS